jgi:NADPH-dependent curcumin reductase CurA
MSPDMLTVRLAERPVDGFVLGQHLRHKKSPAPQASELKESQVLAETIYLSLDPAMRGWVKGWFPFAKPLKTTDRRTR